VGRRLGLLVFFSDREFRLWPRPRTSDATSLELPVVGDAAASAAFASE